MKIKDFLIFLLITILTMTTLIGCSNKKETPKNSDINQETGTDNTGDESIELLISAAASLTDVLEELKGMYKEVAPETTLTFTFGSSGALQSQIEEGAPIDVFMSAAQKQMDNLEKGGHLLNETRKTLLFNNVVLITPKDNDLDIKSFEDITKDDIKKIGVGDPANVPVGQYSEEIFNNLNIKDKLVNKLVLGNDVRAVLTWVETGEVDLGLVYETDAMTSDNINIVDKAPEGSHKEVSYPVAVIKDSKHQEQSRAFLDFLSTTEAKIVFEKYGFDVK